MDTPFVDTPFGPPRFKPHEWPTKLQKSALRPFKTRSLKGWDL